MSLGFKRGTSEVAYLAIHEAGRSTSPDTIVFHTLPYGTFIGIQSNLGEKTS